MWADAEMQLSSSIDPEPELRPTDHRAVKEVVATTPIGRNHKHITYPETE